MFRYLNIYKWTAWKARKRKDGKTVTERKVTQFSIVGYVAFTLESFCFLAGGKKLKMMATENNNNNKKKEGKELPHNFKW